MEEELNQLKSVLRSLVVSSPTQVDARSLLRDYRNMIGTQIPLAKFGYKDPIAFLRERFSDCFIFQGPSGNPELTLIVPDALKHVDKFVQKQKVASTTKYKGKRRSVPESIVKPGPNLIASTFVSEQNLSNKQLPGTYKSETTKENHATPAPPPEQNGSQVFQNKDKNIQNGDSSLEPQGDTKRRTASLYMAYERQQSGTSNDRDLIKEDDHTGRLTSSSSSSSSKRSQLEELRRELRELIVSNPDGVWCTDLLRLYRERHGRELSFFRFGYTSVLSLAGALPGVAASSHPARADWLLRDARAPAPRPQPARSARRTAACDPDDALPGIAFEADVFPPDCVQLLESIPAASLAGVARGQLLEVAVGEVYSPSHFWLLRLGEQHNIAMENLMDDMNRYYASEAGRARRLAPGAVRVGHYCSSLYDGDWHRSLIVKIIDCDTVKVRHVDYGTVERVPAAGLRALRRAWAALAAQAVRARLAGARPPAAGRRWPRAAAHRFLAQVRDRRLVATVVAVDLQDDALEVLLIDTSTDEDVCITDELIRSGHADPRPDSAIGTSECYLFPRFEALESGDTPNFAEIYAYLRDGITLEFVDDFRRHVPPCLPPAASAAVRVGSPPPSDERSTPLQLDRAPECPNTDTNERKADAEDFTPPTPPPLPKPCARLAPRAARRRTPPPPPTNPQFVPQTYSQFTSQPFIPYDYNLHLATSISAFIPQLRPNYHSYVPRIQSPEALSLHVQAAAAPSLRMQAPEAPSLQGQAPAAPAAPAAPSPHSAGAVSLSASQVEAYALLSRVDRSAAHLFMLSALKRALAPPARPGPAHPGPAHPGPAHPGPDAPLRPPPGFGAK